MTDDSDPLDMNGDANRRLARRSGIPPENGGYIHIEELEALIDEWESRYAVDDPINAAKNRMKRYQANECAQELQKLIAEYGDSNE